MSKAILILDMPSNCGECPLCVCDTEYDTLCSALTIKAKDDYTNDVYELVTDEEWTDYRYSKCPLKPMPSKLLSADIMKVMAMQQGINIPRPLYTEEYEHGYNDCIDEILGEDDE